MRKEATANDVSVRSATLSGKYDGETNLSALVIGPESPESATLIG